MIVVTEFCARGKKQYPKSEGPNTIAVSNSKYWEIWCLGCDATSICCCGQLFKSCGMFSSSAMENKKTLVKLRLLATGFNYFYAVTQYNNPLLTAFRWFRVCCATTVGQPAYLVHCLSCIAQFKLAEIFRIQAEILYSKLTQFITAFITNQWKKDFKRLFKQTFTQICTSCK